MPALLYTNPISTNAKRVVAIASELGLPLDQRTIDFAKGENRTEAFLAKNPNGKLPVLEIDGRVCWESPAILYELACRHAEAGLLPSDSAARADVLRWMFWNASHFEPAVFAIAFERLFRKPMTGQEPDEAKVDEHLASFERFAAVLDGHLSDRDWLADDRYTIADIALATSLEMAGPAGIDLAPYDGISAWFERVTSRPSWPKA